MLTIWYDAVNAVRGIRRSPRELAIRAALGANKTSLTAMMLRRELAPVIVGTTVGLAVALIGTTVVFATVFDAHPRNVVSCAKVAGGLLIVASIAGYIPIRNVGATHTSELMHL